MAIHVMAQDILICNMFNYLYCEGEEHTTVLCPSNMPVGCTENLEESPCNLFTAVSN